jgi:hypothetical protein
MLASINVADSLFIGFIEPIKSVSEAKLYQSSLKHEHPLAAHVPYSWILAGSSEIDNDVGFEEDGEPVNSVGPMLFQESCAANKDGTHGFVLVIVRYFGNRLLGVSSGRLSQCYQSISKLTLHRYFNSGNALHEDYTTEPLGRSLYGLGAGDSEVILNILKDVKDENINVESKPERWIKGITDELEFGGFRSNLDEELPRLQNLQADLSSCLVPVYRYPGNYRGDEWTTYQWSPLSFKVKKAVEKNLAPLVEQQMNHCVCNYYRDGSDFIGHHSDKDLDLDREGVIVSVSLGDERILELKRRSQPQDTFRVLLPHGSMLVLGPFTNKLFTHSILTKEDASMPRASLTFRRVLTFLDLNSGRLFGEGVSTFSLCELRARMRCESISFLAGLGVVTSALFQAADKKGRQQIKTGIASTGLIAISYLSYRKARLYFCKRTEEKGARLFFSKTSVHGTKY